mmetsp:Transcript_15699/g.21125  ORF Transcript_15699/g.21125 Transcript_15699/m.21125 type:complete len:147 (-) Transcript_15699:426-866(-)
MMQNMVRSHSAYSGLAIEHWNILFCYHAPPPNEPALAHYELELVLPPTHRPFRPHGVQANLSHDVIYYIVVVESIHTVLCAVPSYGKSIDDAVHGPYKDGILYCTPVPCHDCLVHESSAFESGINDHRGRHPKQGATLWHVGSKSR